MLSIALFISKSKDFTSFAIFSSQETVLRSFLFSKIMIAGAFFTPCSLKSTQVIFAFASFTGVFCVNHLVARTGNW
jgi:hypothetical protein